MYILTFYDQRCCPICDGTVAKLFELSDRSDHEIGTYTALRYYGNPIAHYFFNPLGSIHMIGTAYINRFYYRIETAGKMLTNCENKDILKS